MEYVVKIIIISIVVLVVSNIVITFTTRATSDVITALTAYSPDLTYLKMPCAYFCLSDLNDDEVKTLNYGVTEGICCPPGGECESRLCCKQYCILDCVASDALLAEQYPACVGAHHSEWESGGDCFGKPLCFQCTNLDLNACPYECDSERGYCIKKELLGFSGAERLPFYYSCNYKILDFVQLGIEYGKYKQVNRTVRLEVSIFDNLVFKIKQGIIDNVTKKTPSFNWVNIRDGINSPVTSLTNRIPGINEYYEVLHSNLNHDLISRMYVNGELFYFPFEISESSLTPRLKGLFSEFSAYKGWSAYNYSVSVYREGAVRVTGCPAIITTATTWDVCTNSSIYDAVVIEHTDNRGADYLYSASFFNDAIYYTYGGNVLSMSCSPRRTNDTILKIMLAGEDTYERFQFCNLSYNSLLYNLFRGVQCDGTLYNRPDSSCTEIKYDKGKSINSAVKYGDSAGPAVTTIVYTYDFASSDLTLVPRNVEFGDVRTFGMNTYEDTRAVAFIGYYDNATKYFYDCFNGTGCDDSEKYNMFDFCLNYPQLTHYGYIDCVNPYSLNERFNPESYTIVRQRDKLIDESLSCKSGPYDACNYEVGLYGSAPYGGTRLDDNDEECQPAWETLINKRGGCNDLAIMEYTVFRTLGLPDDYGDWTSKPINVSLSLGACGLPCPCQELVNAGLLTYSEDNCVPYATVTVNPGDVFGAYEPCSAVPDMPDYRGGRYTITRESGGPIYTVYQNHTGDTTYCKYYFDKSFDGDNSNDALKAECSSPSLTMSYDGTFADPCGNSLLDYNKNTLVCACSHYMHGSDRTNFRTAMGASC